MLSRLVTYGVQLALYGVSHTVISIFNRHTLTACTDRAATGAELAAVLLVQRGVAAFLAVLAGQD
jgi:hypothetical protein